MSFLRTYSRGEKLFVAIGLILGLLCLLLLMGLWSRQQKSWFRVVSPANETPAKILAVDRSLRAYVRTTSGNIYLCGGDSLTQSCTPVTAADLPVNPVPPQWQSCGALAPNIPEPPGKVVDSIFVGRCLEASTYSKLAILEDGSIWQWYRTLSWANWFALIVCILLGIGFGTAGAIALVEFRRRLR
jgi:hypothetical protein